MRLSLHSRLKLPDWLLPGLAAILLVHVIVTTGSLSALAALGCVLLALGLNGWQGRDCERDLRAILENTSDSVYFKDRQHRFTRVSATTLRRHHLRSAEDMFGKTDFDLLEHDFAQELWDAEETLFITGQPIPKTLHRHEELWVEVYKVPLRDSAGRIIGLLGINRDMTERRELETQQRNLLRLIDEMPVMLDAFDDNNLISLWNRECERVTGYSAAEIIGNPDALRMLYPDDLYRETMIQRVQSYGRYYRNLEFELTCKDGSRRTIAWSNISREFALPNWPFWTVGVDVTDRKRAETHRLREALEQDRQSLLQEFMQAITHDFRTSLAIIGTSRYLVWRKLPTDQREVVQDHLDIIERHVSRLNDQLSALQVAGTLQALRTSSQNLNRIVAPTVEKYQQRVQAAGVTLTFEPDDTLPDTAVNTGEIQRALSKLLDNAFAFTKAGSSITVRTGQRAGRALIVVQDTGIGIDPAQQARIFDLFYRIDLARPIDKGGIGLGLSLVRLIAEAHGGSVSVESEPGKGSTFTMAFPLL